MRLTIKFISISLYYHLIIFNELSNQLYTRKNIYIFLYFFKFPLQNNAESISLILSIHVVIYRFLVDDIYRMEISNPKHNRIIRPYFERYRSMNHHLHLCIVTAGGIMSDQWCGSGLMQVVAMQRWRDEPPN